jgi:hypothetical protein
MSDPTLDGIKWAERVFDEKLRTGDLPNLGSGYPDEIRAAKAVQKIADKKLFVRDPRSPRKVSAPLRPRDRQFWQAVLDWSNAYIVEYENSEMERNGSPYLEEVKKALSSLKIGKGGRGGRVPLPYGFHIGFYENGTGFELRLFAPGGKEFAVLVRETDVLSKTKTSQWRRDRVWRLTTDAIDKFAGQLCPILERAAGKASEIGR